jgi:hypothetical protein
MRVLTLMLLAATLLGGCYAAPSIRDYPSYATVDALFEGATLVVEASVPEKGRRRDISIGGPGTDSYLVFDAVVSRVLKGTATVGEKVQIKQYADGEQGGEHLAAGRAYLLFLETYPDVPASTLNPTQGQYELDAAGLPTPLPGNDVSISAADLTRLAGE